MPIYQPPRATEGERRAAGDRGPRSRPSIQNLGSRPPDFDLARAGIAKQSSLTVRRAVAGQRLRTTTGDHVIVSVRAANAAGEISDRQVTIVDVGGSYRVVGLSSGIDAQVAAAAVARPTSLSRVTGKGGVRLSRLASRPRGKLAPTDPYLTGEQRAIGQFVQRGQQVTEPVFEPVHQLPQEVEGQEIIEDWFRDWLEEWFGFEGGATGERGLFG